MDIVAESRMMLNEIIAEVAAPTTTWNKEPLQDAELYKGTGLKWTIQVLVMGGAKGRARMGTAVSKQRLTIVRLPDELALAAEVRALASFAEKRS